MPDNSTLPMDPQLEERYKKIMSEPANSAPQPINPEPLSPEKPTDTTALFATQPLAKNEIPSSREKVKIDYQIPKQEHSRIPWPVYVLAGISFFVVYTYFWIKIFNISIPYLP